VPTIYSKESVKEKNSHSSGHKRASHSHLSPLTSFAVFPTGIHFETQQVDEQVVIFLRQHLIVNLGWVIVAIIMAIAPTVVFPFILSSLKLPFAIPIGYLVVGTIFWYVAAFGFVIASFLRWYFNIYIVTNERVVDVDFLHLLYKELSEARLVDIQDITYKTGGLLETLFNYGNVYIQTAGTEPNFEFLAVPNPEVVVQTVSELIEKEKLRFK